MSEASTTGRDTGPNTANPDELNPSMQDTAAIPRLDPEPQADELTGLPQWVDYHRATLLLKCDGLSETQLKERAVPPSSMSLLGLLRHLTEVETNWFVNALDGREKTALYYSDDDPDGDFDSLDSASVDEVYAAYHAAVAESRRIYAGFTSADTVGRGTRHDPAPNVRWVMIHLVEEYARHNGHADLLRERIDGVRGE